MRNCFAIEDGDLANMNDSDPNNDTHPAIAAMIIEGYRKMTPARKLKLVDEINYAVELLALANIRSQHPDADEREQRMRLASRRYGAEVMLRVFGWDVKEHGH